MKSPPHVATLPAALVTSKSIDMVTPCIKISGSLTAAFQVDLALLTNLLGVFFKVKLAYPTTPRGSFAVARTCQNLYISLKSRDGLSNKGSSSHDRERLKVCLSCRAALQMLVGYDGRKDDCSQHRHTCMQLFRGDTWSVTA